MTSTVRIKILEDTLDAERAICTIYRGQAEFEGGNIRNYSTATGTAKVYPPDRTQELHRGNKRKALRELLGQIEEDQAWRTNDRLYR